MIRSFAPSLATELLPAIAIDGMLAFSSLPKANQFECELELEQRKWGGVVGGIAFLAGLFFSVNPVAIAAIPISFA
jgi:hypothetical protein